MGRLARSAAAQQPQEEGEVETFVGNSHSEVTVEFFLGSWPLLKHDVQISSFESSAGGQAGDHYSSMYKW